MKSTQYSEKVLDHFRNPRNTGTLEGENVAVGRVGNPTCGDLMEIYIDVKDDTINDIKFKTFGCGSAIATASMVTELAKGKTLDEAEKITRGDVAHELDGLPPVKMHCSNLAADALKDAIRNYREKGKQPSAANDEAASGTEPIEGEKEFAGKGVYYHFSDPVQFIDKRVMVLWEQPKPLEQVLELTKYTPRVILVTQLKDIPVSEELKNKLTGANIKILSQAKLLKISGFNEVEKVLMQNLAEDEQYELFVDAVLIL